MRFECSNRLNTLIYKNIPLLLFSADLAKVLYAFFLTPSFIFWSRRTPDAFFLFFHPVIHLRVTSASNLLYSLKVYCAIVSSSTMCYNCDLLCTKLRGFMSLYLTVILLNKD